VAWRSHLPRSGAPANPATRLAVPKVPVPEASSYQRSQGTRGEIHGSGEFEFEIVGESNYQKALKAIAGPKARDGKNHECTAKLILEDDNPHDSKAVRVDIDGRTVGYLARDMARECRSRNRKRRGARAASTSTAFR
jgi:hypothetical protein